MAKEKAKPRRKRKFVAILSNHTDRRDDESKEVWGYDMEDARKNLSFDTTRFSLRTILTAADARKNWA